MHIMSTNFAKTLVWKYDYDVELWRHKERTPNKNDHHMPLNEPGPSPEFSSRGGQKPERGATFLKYSIGCMQQPVGQRWNGWAPILNGGLGTTGPPLATTLEWTTPHENFLRTPLTLVLYIGPCHCSYLYRSMSAAFRVHVAGDLDKNIYFKAGVLSTSFARALLGLVR